MSGKVTCTTDIPEPTLDQILDAVDAVLAVPQPIGTLLGVPVYLHHDTREISWGENRCSVSHPFLAGTKIYDTALRALGEIESP